MLSIHIRDGVILQGLRAEITSKLLDIAMIFWGYAPTGYRFIITSAVGSVREKGETVNLGLSIDIINSFFPTGHRSVDLDASCTASIVKNLRAELGDEYDVQHHYSIIRITYTS